MHSLHIFNPDTDYALAADREFYTPPRRIVELRKKLALLPALYASDGDSVILLDSPDKSIQDLEYYDLCVRKHIKILTTDEIIRDSEFYLDHKLMPWGWNRNIRRVFLDLIGNNKYIPNEQTITKIRNLSHRRNTIKFLEYFIPLLDNEIEMPKEFSSVEEAMCEYEMQDALYFKAPWSSSGRGIMLTDDLEKKHVFPWINGIIRRQGSVIAEKAYKRKLDFATEWILSSGKAQFLGYSIFKVSRRGKYHGNINASQQKLLSVIKENTTYWTDEMLDMQRETIENLIGSDYDGPLGIDMLITESGAINPCVEINLRLTMGMIGLI